MKNCPNCRAVLTDNAVQCHICGYVYQQQQQYYQQYPNVQQNYAQQQYNQQSQVQNPQVGYQQPNTQQYYQQYQQPQYYSYGPQNQTTANNYLYGNIAETKSAKIKDKKQRPLWVKILIGISVTIGVIWVISDAMNGAEKADEWFKNSTQEAQMAEIEAEIVNILDSTKVESYLTPTIGQMVIRVFNDFDIAIECDEDSESIYYVKISGDYSPSPGYSYYSMNGSITYRVDIDKRICTVWSDPNNIHAIFIAYIVS